MRNKLAFIFSLAALLLIGQPVFADDDPIHTMANIMVHLEHYPSSSEKKSLMSISNSSSASANAKTLATAIANLQHKATSADKPKLQAIINDGSASANEKTLAKIVLNLSHMPSASDKAELDKMMK